MKQFLVAIFILALAVNASAGSITLMVTAQGRYTSGMCVTNCDYGHPDGGWTGNNEYAWLDPTTRNYFTGYNENMGAEYLSYFAFDLTNVTEPIEGATLYVYNSGYQGSDATETFTLFDVETPAVTVLGQNYNAAARLIADDLGSGAIFGSVLVDTSNPAMLQIAINSLGLASMNTARGGLFVIGGRVTSIGQTVEQEGIFSGSGDGFGWGCKNYLHIGPGDPQPAPCVEPPPPTVPEGLNTSGALFSSILLLTILGWRHHGRNKA